MNTTHCTNDTDSTTIRRSGRSIGKAARTALVSLVAVIAGVTALAGPAAADSDYRHYSTDDFSFSTSNGAAKASGSVKWYVGDRLILPDVFRGEYSGRVTLQRAGCLYAQIRWNKVTGTVSWPPSGSASTTSDGYYKKCGPAGTSLSLNGQAYASSALFRTCIDIGYGSSSSAPRSYQASKCMLN